MTPVSALIITRNEELVIERCLKSLLWADEIVVVDAESTDRTPQICQDPRAPWAGKLRFFSRAWSNFREQRNFMLDQAQHEWVLVLDADEECSPELAVKIRGLLGQPGGPPSKAYKIHRTEYFLGKPIRYGIWNPSYQDRFFARTGVRYTNEIHEYPLFSVAPDRIHETIHHWPDFNPDRFLEKMNKYTTIEAYDRVIAGRRTNWFRMISAFPAMFLKNYFYYSAYRDGIHGVAISVLEGISRAVRHVKIWKISREIDAEKATR